MIEARLKVADFADKGEVGLADAMRDPYLMRESAHQLKVQIWAELFLENLDRSIGALRRALAASR